VGWPRVDSNGSSGDSPSRARSRTDQEDGSSSDSPSRGVPGLDSNGSSIDNSGIVIDHVDYSAFGTVLDENNPSAGDRFVGFAGLTRDSVTDLNLAIERAENPSSAAGRRRIRKLGEVICDPSGFALRHDHEFLARAIFSRLLLPSMRRTRVRPIMANHPFFAQSPWLSPSLLPAAMTETASVG